MLSVRIAEGRGFIQGAHSTRNGRTSFSSVVFLDGMPQPPPVDVNNLPTPKDVAGIEIYSGFVTAPLRC